MRDDEVEFIKKEVRIELDAIPGPFRRENTATGILRLDSSKPRASRGSVEFVTTTSPDTQVSIIWLQYPYDVAKGYTCTFHTPCQVKTKTDNSAYLFERCLAISLLC